MQSKRLKRFYLRTSQCWERKSGLHTRKRPHDFPTRKLQMECSSSRSARPNTLSAEKKSRLGLLDSSAFFKGNPARHSRALIVRSRGREQSAYASRDSSVYRMVHFKSGQSSSAWLHFVHGCSAAPTPAPTIAKGMATTRRGSPIP